MRRIVLIIISLSVCLAAPGQDFNSAMDMAHPRLLMKDADITLLEMLTETFGTDAGTEEWDVPNPGKSIVGYSVSIPAGRECTISVSLRTPAFP